MSDKAAAPASDWGAATPPLAQEVRSDIERTLQTRRVRRGKVLLAVEDRAKKVGAKVWERVKGRPYAGIAAASALGFGVASQRELVFQLLPPALRTLLPIGRHVRMLAAGCGHRLLLRTRARGSIRFRSPVSFVTMARLRLSAPQPT